MKYLNGFRSVRISVWGASGKDVYAKSLGFGFDLTLKYSPKFVLLILQLN